MLQYYYHQLKERRETRYEKVYRNRFISRNYLISDFGKRAYPSSEFSKQQNCTLLLVRINPNRHSRTPVTHAIIHT